MQIGTAVSQREKIVKGTLKLGEFDPGNGQNKNLEIPVFIAEGKAEGPNILFLAGFSGLDSVSTYSLYRFVEKLDAKSLSGRVIILPILNIPAYYASSKIQPFDGKMIENSFPGNSDGSITEQICDTLMGQAIEGVDLVVYLQDAEGNVATEAYIQIFGPDEMVKENDIALQKALELGTEIIEVEDPVEGHFAVEVHQRYSVTVVKMLVGAMRGKGTKASVERIIQCLENLLSKEGMLKSKADLPNSQYVLDSFDSIFSGIGGTWQSEVELGEFVKKGDLVGVLLNPEIGEKQEIYASYDGKVTQLNEAVKVLKHDKLATILPITDAKESPVMNKAALRVVTNGNK